MAKKRKPEYEDLSDKERSRLELKGMKDNNNDVSISALDAGKAAYKSELKERKKTNRQQKKDLKKRGSVDSEAPVVQTKTPREKKVESAVKQVEKMTNTPESFDGMTQGQIDAQKIKDNSTWANEDGTITEARSTMGPGTGSTTATPSFSTNPRFQSPDIVKATSAQGLENLQKQKDNDVIDNVRNARANSNYYAEAENAIGQVDEQVKEESDKVKAAQSLNDLVNNPDNVSDEELEAGKTLTTEDVAEMEKEVQDAIISGSPDAEAMKREFNNYLNESKFNAAEPAIEKLGVQQYYPDLGTPLQVGSYSGSRIGTVSIFGHGSDRIPVGIMDARRRALDKAAAKRAKNKNKIIEMAYAKGAIPLQGRLDDKAWEMINKYSELSGNNIGKLDYNTKLGRQYWKEVREHNTFAARTKMTEKIVNQLSKDVLDDTKYVPQFVQDEMAKFNRGLLGEDLNMKTINSSEKRLRAWTEATGVLNELDKKRLQLDEAPVNPNLDWSNPEVVKSANDAILKIRGGNYDNIFTLTKKFMDPYRIEALIDPIIEQNNLYLGEGTKKSAEEYREQYFNYVLGLHPEIVTDKLTNIIHNSANKRAAMRSSERIANPPTILDQFNNRIHSQEQLQAKQDLLMEIDLQAQGAGTSSDIRKAYNEYTDLEPKGDFWTLTGEFPLDDAELNTDYEAPGSTMKYNVDGVGNLSLEEANRRAQGIVRAHIEEGGSMETFERENPGKIAEYRGLAKLASQPNTNATFRMKNAEHNFAFTNDWGRREKATTSTYADNEANMYNLITRNYEGTFTVDEPKIGPDGKPAMVYLGADGEKYFSLQAVSDAGTSTTSSWPLKEQVEYKLPTAYQEIEVEDDISRAMGNVRYNKANRQLGTSFKSGNVQGYGSSGDSDDGIIESSSSSSSSSSDDAAAGFMQDLENGR
jgi:hypothetical protein